MLHEDRIGCAVIISGLGLLGQIGTEYTVKVRLSMPLYEGSPEKAQSDGCDGWKLRQEEYILPVEPGEGREAQGSCGLFPEENAGLP